MSVSLGTRFVLFENIFVWDYYAPFARLIVLVPSAFLPMSNRDKLPRIKPLGGINRTSYGVNFRPGLYVSILLKYFSNRL